MSCSVRARDKVMSEGETYPGEGVRNNSILDDGEGSSSVGSSSEAYLRLIEERDEVDAESCPIVHRLITQELERISKGAGKLEVKKEYIDLVTNEPVTLNLKALLPDASKTYPKINYAGRILGPKGTYLKALKAETKTRMVILGRGTLKDKAKEDELRNGNDPNYSHLHEDMHVEIQVRAPAAEAYAKIAYALKCLRIQLLNDGKNLPWIASATTHVDQGRFGGSDPSTPEYTDTGTFYQPTQSRLKPYYKPVACHSPEPRMYVPQSGSTVTSESINKMRSLLHRYSDGKASLSSATRVFDSGRKNTLTFEQESHHYDGDDDARIKNSRSDFVAAPEIPKVLRDRDSGSSWRFASQAQTHSQRYAPYTKK